MTSPLRLDDRPVPLRRDGGGRPSAVRVAGLAKTYPNGVVALDRVSFTVGEGEVFGLLGPNGAGKTTTVGILTTTVRPSGGQAEVGGIDVVDDPIGVRQRLGVVFQDSVLDNDFSGLDNLRLHARLWGMPRVEAEERIGSLLGVMGLAGRAGDGVGTYSGGMRRRLEIARGLLARPRVLFLDEPTVGLDPAVRAKIWGLIGRLRSQEGVTIVLTTHYLEEAEAVCDRVGILHRGRLVALGEPRALIDELGGQLLELRVADDGDEAAAALVAAGLSARPPLVAHGLVSLTSTQPAKRLTAVAGGLTTRLTRVSAATVRATTLNDVYLHLTADGAAELGGE